MPWSDDESPCDQTNATLLAEWHGHDTAEITARLGLEPSPPGVIWYRHSHLHRDRTAVTRSKDLRDHLDLLLGLLLAKKNEYELLVADGCKFSLSCHYTARKAGCGPTLSPLQMQKVCDLGLDLKLYFEPVDICILEGFSHILGESPEYVKAIFGTPDLVPREPDEKDFTWGYLHSVDRAIIVRFENGVVVRVSETARLK